MPAAPATRHAIVTASIAALAVAGLALIWYGADVLLLVFTGILIALLLRGIADWVAERTPIPSGVAVAGVVCSVATLLGMGGWLLADNVAAQFNQLIEQVPLAITTLTERLASYPWGRVVLSWMPDTDAFTSPQALGRATGVLSTTLGTTIGAVANVVIVAFVALYLAADPGLYVRGVVRLVPVARRDRAREMLRVLGHTLRRWLAGKLVAMAVIGVLTGAGLWIIGVPLALTLGLLAAMLNFVPYLGPLLSFIPAVLLALMESPAMAAWVLGLYLVVQFVESYVLTPLIDQRSVALPPALTIVAQVMLGTLLGALGLVLASPLMAATLVVVQMLYIEEALGDDIDRPVTADAPGGRRLREVRP